MDEISLGDDPDYKTIDGKAYERRDAPQRRHCRIANVHDEHPWVVIKSDREIKWWSNLNAATDRTVEYETFVCPGVRRN